MQLTPRWRCQYCAAYRVHPSSVNSSVEEKQFKSNGCINLADQRVGCVLVRMFTGSGTNTHWHRERERAGISSRRCQEGGSRRLRSQESDGLIGLKLAMAGWRMSGWRVGDGLADWDIVEVGMAQRGDWAGGKTGKIASKAAREV